VPPSQDFSTAERDRLARFADVILPPTESMPAASDVGVQHALLDRVLGAIPALAPLLHQAVMAVGLEPAQTLADLRAHRPAVFSAVMLAVTAGYYLSPRVREFIGYHGQEARTIDVHELPAYLEDGSLDRVTARGPLYQDVG
jgi:hypothetical protein